MPYSSCFLSYLGVLCTLTRTNRAEKVGIPRVREALESNDWAQLDDSPLSDFGDFEADSSKDVNPSSANDPDLDPENLDFGYDKADFEGMRKAIWDNAAPPPPADGDDKIKAEAPKEEVGDEDVVAVERMMRKLQAVREAGEGMGEEQRKRMAARAVKEVMDSLDE